MTQGFAASPTDAPPRPPSALSYLIIGIVALMLCIALAVRVRTERAAADAIRLMLGLIEAESAQRGYLITGERAFLAPYVPARRALHTSLDELDALYTAQSGQDLRLKRLRGLIAAKFAEMDDTLRMRDAGRAEAARAQLLDQRGRRLTEAMRTVTDDFIGGEKVALSASLGRVVRQRQTIDRWIAFTLALVAIGVAGGLALSWRGRQARYRLQRASWDALARMRAIFAGTSDAMLTLNPSGSIETANVAVTRMLGYGADELDRRDIATLIDLAPGSEGSFADRVGLVDGVFAAPFRTGRSARHRDGHLVPVDVALGVMQLADGDHVVVALRDVTERHEAERLKDEFVGTVSHELRTPLTSVIGALGLLRSGTAGELPPQAQRLADIAENNARRLIRLINDMLDIDRIRSGRCRACR